MIQYHDQVDGWQDFFAIWRGGIVLYGGIISGGLAFVGFYYLFLRRAGVPFWKLVDAIGPTLALGIALGRVGCFLNGCCWGHAAPAECPSVGFPLLSCPAEKVVVDDEGYQTKTGFTTMRGPDGLQSVVDRLEPGSAADRAGLRAGDRITAVNGRKNGGVLSVASDNPELLNWAADTAREKGAVVEPDPGTGGKGIRIVTDDPATATGLKTLLKGRLVFLGQVFDTDVYSDLIHKKIHGETSLDLTVDRNGQEVHIGPFTPRTIGLHPTQLYETVSMLLLMVLLLSFYPFRAYDGQVFTLFISAYAVHRFLNEALRNDTEIVGLPALHMTLSQNISLLMLLFAAGLETFHRMRRKRLARAAATPAGQGV